MLLWMAGPYGGFNVRRSDVTGLMTVEVAVSGILVP